MGAGATKPHIDGSAFGSITVEGTVFEHDIVIRPDGAIKKRKKKLSKAIYGTSHTISLPEAEHLCARAAGTKELIVGTGQYGNVELSPEAAEYLQRKHYRVLLLQTPQAIDRWNQTTKTAIGLFHVTC